MIFCHHLTSAMLEVHGSSWKFMEVQSNGYLNFQSSSACDVALRRLFLRSRSTTWCTSGKINSLWNRLGTVSALRSSPDNLLKIPGCLKMSQVYSAYGVFPLFCSQSYSPFPVTELLLEYMHLDEQSFNIRCNFMLHLFAYSIHLNPL